LIQVINLKKEEEMIQVRQRVESKVNHFIGRSHAKLAPNFQAQKVQAKEDDIIGLFRGWIE